MFCAQCGQWMAEGRTACDRCGAGAGLPPAGMAAPPARAAAPPVEVRYAGFWRRVGVMLIDALVVFFPAAIVRVALGGEIWDTRSAFADRDAMAWTAFNLTITWLYCALFECSAAQGTLGQQVFGIRVCDDRLKRISFLRACARHFAQWLSVFTCGLGYVVSLWTRRRQTLHDLVAGCVLVRDESLAELARAEAA